MEAYFDNSATTKVFDCVKDIVVKTMTEDYGNAASRHIKGVEAERYIREARSIIAKSLKVQDKEIVFTSGGSESNNMALIGGAMANRRRGGHIISTNVEHSSVYNTLGFLGEQGFEITYLPVDGHGHISLSQLKDSLRKDTILVSVMYVNNEVGSVQPIEEIGALIHEKAPGALFHVDAIQAFGKYRIHPARMGIDLLSVSGHKIHGPKGVGFLYVKGGAKIQPQILGGGQQNGMRSGTDNVPGIAGMGAAVEEVYRDFDKKREHMYQVKGILTEGLEAMDGVVLNGMPVEKGAPHIISASFVGIRSEVLLHALEDRGVYVSAGSACSTHKRAASATLTAMGLESSQRESTVRFSLCSETTEEEVRYCLEVLEEILLVLRKYSRR